MIWVYIIGVLMCLLFVVALHEEIKPDTRIKKDFEARETRRHEYEKVVEEYSMGYYLTHNERLALGLIENEYVSNEISKEDMRRKIAEVLGF